MWLLKLKIFLLTIFVYTSAFAFEADIIQVCFSPHGGCEQAIIKQLANAKEEIKIQAYSFTSAPIAKALLDAHRRGVSVEIILDKSQKKQRYSSYTFFKNQGIPVLIDAAHAIAHNKIIIIDQQIVITGSFNFTKAAESKNAENVLIVKSKKLAEIYSKNWKGHKDHAF
jgi:phosphatidylserine/phosphatidylglycerophosphate/cardiolipin synthase-like enzyme